ncbi:menaquinol-cytochrome c reductase iron-sulfur protein [Gordonia hirsuta DSM 44140 = NBRC 16056]|uniref:Cytochrome bc1 complex Rieske iron-sulfur subunit n=1 Tax=Gordonia hirsuta DSM 44140 = NBRC 16056 TaxID=1121927 RepID=L7L4G1_9ACTN|nr:ubiquinol-cytochrome c reductase iron-sulfur subunit [Gordonia hirsuta]GAC55834.1 menaquinol-cytochrome c reductase iron-sulfur protein [Gordonia hirsuta DSM 44140 = NBRC 16056]
MSATSKDAPTGDQLDAMSRDELVQLGTNLDDVEIIYREPRYPVEGTKAEKRSERVVAFWFVLSGLAAIAGFALFIWNNWEFTMPNQDGYWAYTYYTPALGVSFGVAILSFGFGVIQLTKRFIPAEISVQQRHDGPSEPADQKTLAAELDDALQTSTLPRRKMILGSAAFGLGSLTLAGGVAAIGGFIKNPWADKKDDLWQSGWSQIHNPATDPNETVFLRRDTGNPYQVALVRPEDLDAGAMETVFPWRVSDGYGETEESRHKLLSGLRSVRNPVMLIRLRAADSERVIKRRGQESFNYGDYYAYTKVCSHLGCPTSLYEQRTNRILCPCHQSQFDALEFAKPVFGPAARALAQLPITVNNQGYMIANTAINGGDFIEPVGPAFWERKS